MRGLMIEASRLGVLFDLFGGVAKGSGLFGGSSFGGRSHEGPLHKGFHLGIPTPSFHLWSLLMVQPQPAAYSIEPKPENPFQNPGNQSFSTTTNREALGL